MTVRQLAALGVRFLSVFVGFSMLASIPHLYGIGVEIRAGETFVFFILVPLALVFTLTWSMWSKTGNYVERIVRGIDDEVLPIEEYEQEGGADEADGPVDASAARGSDWPADTPVRADSHAVEPAVAPEGMGVARLPDILPVGTGLIGIWLAAMGLVGVVPLVITFVVSAATGSQMDLGSHSIDPIGQYLRPEATFFSLLPYLLELAVGLYLFFGAGSIRRIWERYNHPHRITDDAG